MRLLTVIDAVFTLLRCTIWGHIGRKGFDEKKNDWIFSLEEEFSEAVRLIALKQSG